MTESNMTTPLFPIMVLDRLDDGIPMIEENAISRSYLGVVQTGERGSQTLSVRVEPWLYDEVVRACHAPRMGYMGHPSNLLRHAILELLWAVARATKDKKLSNTMTRLNVLRYRAFLLQVRAAYRDDMVVFGTFIREALQRGQVGRVEEVTKQLQDAVSEMEDEDWRRELCSIIIQSREVAEGVAALAETHVGWVDWWDYITGLATGVKEEHNDDE